MKCIRVGAASINQTPLDWTRNCDHILAAIKRARAQKLTILSLPELCITGYGCEDLFLTPHLIDKSWDILHEKIAPATSDMIVSVGLPISYQNSHYNAVALIVDTVVCGFTIKQFLAGDGVHYESRWFKAWPAHVVTTLTRDNKSYPIGDIHFSVGGVRIGFEICEDAWVAQRPGANLAFQGVDIIMNPSASHFAREKFATRKRFVEEGSRAFGVTYIYSNLVGNEAGNVIFDGGCLIAHDGRVIAAEERFTYHDYGLISATVDIDYTRANRNQISSYRPVVDSDLSDCMEIPFEYPEVPPLPDQRPSFPAWEASEFLPFEEFTRAAALGLFDYLRKSYSHGFALSLSGGADSGCIASLIAAMVHLGIDSLGLAQFLGHLSYIPKIKELRELLLAQEEDSESAAIDVKEEDIVAILLTCVYQATDNSSSTTRHAACAVASAIGATYYEINVQGVVDAYRQLIENAVGRELTWERDDITLQNIQARTRAPSVWMLANLENRLLLATSNRSEASVGYATMDGDTAGGISPIAGVDKPFVRSYLVWLAEIGFTTKNNAHPFRISALDTINRQQPTAELRPKEEAQTDEDDLMPYKVLNTIEALVVKEKQSPKEIFQTLRVKYPHTSPTLLLCWIERFLKLFTRNQWKRERYAPGFFLGNYSLDPKSWYRFPILSAGFRNELNDLKSYVEENFPKEDSE